MAVRLEKVVLSLEDNFTTEMARAAAATALLDKNLDSLSGSAVRSRTSMRDTSRDVDQMGRSADKSSHSINQLTGRLRLMLDAAAVLGPALVPIGAVGVAGIAGLVAQLGFATLGATSLLIAAQGVGDALKAVEAARLEPTAENIAKAQQAMAKLAPEAREFVDTFQEIRPVLGDLQKAAARGWFPGLTDALGSLETAAPRIERILEAISRAGGDAVADGADSLAGDRWRDFFDYIETEAPGAVTDLSRAVGSLTHGLAELLMVMDPGNDGLREWLVDTAAAFDDWATGLDDADVEEFFDYLSETGPKVASAAGAVANAILQIIEAAAPLGGPSLKIIEAFADAIAAIADSDLGTPILAGVAALSLYTRGLQAAVALQAKFTGSQAMSNALATGGVWGATKTGVAGIKAATPSLSQFGTVMYRAGQSSKYASEQTLAAREAVRGFSAQASRAVAPVAGLTLATSGAADSFGLANTASMGLIGWGVGGPIGAAIGSGIGLVTDITSATQAWADTVRQANAAIKAGDIDAQNAALARYEERLKRLKDTNDTTGIGDFFDDIWSAQLWNEGFDIDGQIKDVEEGIRALQTVGELTPGAGLTEIGYQLAGAAQQAQMAADAMQDFATEYADLNAILTKQGAWDAYQASIDKMTESIKRNGRTLDDNTAKGRENRANLRDMADSIANYSQQLVGADRDDYLRGAIKQFKESAIAAGGLDKETREVLRSLRSLIGVNPKPKIEMTGTQETLTQLARIKAAIDAIRSKTVTIQTIRDAGHMARRADAADAHPQGAVQQADGGLVVGPGGPRDDRIPTWLSNREYVIPAHIVEEFGVDFFDALRAGEYSGAEGLASGGQRGKKGKRNKNRGGVLVAPGWGAFADFDELPKSLKGVIASLEKSKSAIEEEASARAAVADSLRSSITDRLTSELFGETDVWTAGSTYDDVMAKLNADSARGEALSANIAALRGKGLDEEALAALLGEADDATIAAWSEMSAEQLDTFEREFNRRAEITARVGNEAVTAAFGEQLAGTNDRLDNVTRELQVLQQITSGVGRAAGDAVAQSKARGANASRSMNRSSLTP